MARRSPLRVTGRAPRTEAAAPGRAASETAAPGTTAVVTGQAVVAARDGGPEVLRVRPWPVRPPGAGELRIRVEAAGIGFADLLMCQGLHPERYLPRRRRAPFVPGWDLVGVVEAAGAGVSRVRPGDRVAALAVTGGWAEYAVVPAAWAVPVPAGLTPVRAVCAVMDHVVAWQMLTRLTHAAPGDTALVQGAAGGVGTALTQVARHLGVRVLGADRASGRAHVEAHGGVLIDFEHEDVAARARELTGGRGADLAYDGIGATARTSLRALRPGGRMVWYGMVTLLPGGAREWRGAVRTAARLAGALAGNLRPGGPRTSVYSVQLLARRHPGWYRHDLAAMLALMADGVIVPEISAVRALDSVPEGLRSLASGAPAPGKQVIAVTPGARGTA